MRETYKKYLLVAFISVLMPSGLVAAESQDNGSSNQKQARQANRKIEDVNSFEKLIDELNSGNAYIQSKAAESLGKTGDERAIEPLMRVLKRGNPDCRQAAAEALVKIGKSAIEPLLFELESKSSWTKDNIIKALIKTGINTEDPQIIKLHIAAFKYMDFDDRKKETEMLVKIGKPAVEPLITVLNDERSYVRESAAEALGMIGDANAEEALIAALKDKDPTVQERAAEALGNIGDLRAFEPLIGVLKGSYSDVHNSIEKALDKLITKVNDEKQKAIYFIAKGSWEECIKIGEPAIEPLITALKDDNSEVRKNATETLGKIGGNRAVEALYDRTKRQ